MCALPSIIITKYARNQLCFVETLISFISNGYQHLSSQCFPGNLTAERGLSARYVDLCSPCFEVPTVGVCISVCLRVFVWALVCISILLNGVCRLSCSPSFAPVEWLCVCVSRRANMLVRLSSQWANSEGGSWVVLMGRSRSGVKGRLGGGSAGGERRGRGLII